MTVEEKEVIINDLAAKVKQASKDEMELLKTELAKLDATALNSLLEKDLAEAKSVKDLTDLVTEMKEDINSLKDAADKKTESNETVTGEIVKNKDKLIAIVKGSKEEIQLKTTVTRASITDNTESVRLGGIGQLGVKKRALYDLFAKFPVGVGNHNGTITYMDFDEDSIVRNAAAVAEGAQFPESEAVFIEKSATLKKIGDTLPVTEEFGEDEVLAAAELENFLDVNVRSVIDNQIAVGDGASNRLLGLISQVPAFTAVASSIQDANIKDLVRKMRTAIVKPRGSKYTPNFVAANSEVIDSYMLKKDANNNYIFDEATGRIAGLEIVEDNNLADDTLVVGEGRFGRIYELGGITISEGLVGTQFKGDLKTIKARARLLFLIREVDKTGFLKSTGIAANLVTLASDPD
jgi:hypothetical protein